MFMYINVMRFKRVDLIVYEYQLCFDLRAIDTTSHIHIFVVGKIIIILQIWPKIHERHNLFKSRKIWIMLTLFCSLERNFSNNTKKF